MTLVRPLYFGFIGVAFWTFPFLPAQENSQVSATLASVPFVGCKSDGQAGPLDAPKSARIEVRLDPKTAEVLALYMPENGPAVLGPRGWSCFGAYGSAGTSLDVTPPRDSPDHSITDFGIHITWRTGDTSGRFSVAQIVARVFPEYRSFVEKIIAEGPWAPANDFPFGPFPGDRLTYLSERPPTEVRPGEYRNDRVVEYETPPHSQGLGTYFGLSPGGNSIRGVAILVRETDNSIRPADENFDLLGLALRLPQDMNDISQVIIRQFEVPEPVLQKQPARLQDILGFQAIGKDTLWIWGIRQSSPFVLQTADAGARWQACPLPPAAAHDISARLLLDGSLPGFEVHAVSRRDVVIDWRTSNKDGNVTSVNSARTNNGCQHWDGVEGKVTPPSGAALSDLEILPDGFHVQWLPGHKYGWALLTGACCGSGQQVASMVRTENGGRTWNVLQGRPAITVEFPNGQLRAERQGIPDWVNEGFAMRSLDDGWFASAHWGDSRPGLWRLSYGGEIWADVGKTLPVPLELKDNADVTGATAPVFSKTRPQEGFFTAQFTYLVDGGKSVNGQAEVRYETKDNGATWHVSEVNMHDADRAPDPDSLQGMSFINAGRTIGYRPSRNAGAIDGIIYTTDGATLQRVHFALRIDELFVPAGESDLSVLYGVQRQENRDTDNNDIKAIFRSTDQGRTWNPVITEQKDAQIPSEANLLAFALAPVRAQSPSPVQTFNQLFDGKFSGDAKFDASKKEYASLWGQLDEVALAELNRSGSPDALMKVFAGLRGYRDANPGNPYPGRLPSKGLYAVTVSPGTPRRIITTYELWANVPGHLAVFEENKGRWQRPAHLDTDDPVEAFLLSAGSTAPLLLTVEKAQGADSDHAHVSLWRVNAKGLLLYRDVGKFMDWDLKLTNGEALLTSSEMPTKLFVSVSGPRIDYETRIVLKSGGATVSQVCVTPWIKTVDEYFGDLEVGHPEQALRLLHDPSIQKLLPKKSDDAEMESGNLQTGTGVVIFRTNAGRLRVEVGREANGEWKIQSAAKE